MKTRKLLAVLLCVCLFPVFSLAESGDVSLSVGGYTYCTAPADATEIDLGETVLPMTEDGVSALEAFLQQLPSLTRFDMFATDITVPMVLYLGEKYPQIKFGWTILIPCENTERRDRPPHRLRTDQTAFSTQHNLSCTSHGQDVWEVLKYCPDLLALDLGHNNSIDDLSFLRYVPKLRVLIMSFNIWQRGGKKPYVDISPIGDMKDLEYLEICKSNIADISPLANCTKLIDLNISTSYIHDLTPLYGLKHLRRLYLYGCDGSRAPIAKSEVAKLKEHLPDCEINNTHVNCGGHWRAKGKDGNPSHYDTLFSMFSYQDLQKPQAYEPFVDSSFFGPGATESEGATEAE